MKFLAYLTTAITALGCILPLCTTALGQGGNLPPLIPPSQSGVLEVPGSGPRVAQDSREATGGPFVPPNTTSPPAASPGLREATQEDTVLLDFYGSRCEPCKKMDHIIKELAQKGYPIRKINVEQNQAACIAYKVDSIPCFIMLVNGKVVDRVVGVTTLERLERMCKLGVPPPSLVPPPAPAEAEGYVPPSPPPRSPRPIPPTPENVELPVIPAPKTGPRLKPQPAPQPDTEEVIDTMLVQKIKLEQMTNHLYRLRGELEAANDAMADLVENLDKLGVAAAKLRTGNSSP